MEPWTITDEEAAALRAAGEHFAAGFLCGERVSTPMRHARGLSAYLERCALLPYHGEPLYPAGASIWARGRADAGTCGPPVIDLAVSYVCLDLCLNGAAAAERAQAAVSPVERGAFEKLRCFCETYPRGGGWTHSIIQYGRALAEGLTCYEARIRRRMADTSDGERIELYRALLVVLAALDGYRARVADHLGGLRFGDPAAERNRERLAAAYRSGLPMRPAAGFFEALVAVTFLFAVDGSDNLGRFDQYMLPYYRADHDAERIGRAEAVALIRTLWRYVDDCGGWNVALGGSARDGREASNDLTVMCLEAARGMRRPNLALRLRADTPERVWDAALDTLATGAGLPALYSEEGYRKALDAAHLNLPDEDRNDFAFGGCTEVMVHGCSNVGSLDGDFSVIQALEQCLHRRLAACPAFDDLLEAFEADLRAGIAELTARVCRNQETRAAYHPQLIRTLLVDDCIERGTDYYNGGARHNWSVINIVGLSNAVDSLSAVRRCIYEDRRVEAGELLRALACNFDGCDDLRAYLERLPHFGNDDPQVDGLARRLSGMVYQEFKRYAPWRGGKFLCGTLMFTTYGWFGRPVGATPDGRRAGTPVGDSAGPVQGRDRCGPTAMLRSVASLQQVHAPGTLVVNLRLSCEHFTTAEGRARLKALVRGYFALGGMQLQINVVDQAVVRDAIAHPERHGDLIVRVGGYSEYFNRLDEDLKLSILKRTEHVI